MEVRATWGDHRAAIGVAGRDIYAVSAPIVVEACVRVLAYPPATGGTCVPAELFDTSDFLHALQPHLAVMRTDGERSASRR